MSPSHTCKDNVLVTSDDVGGLFYDNTLMPLFLQPPSQTLLCYYVSEWQPLSNPSPDSITSLCISAAPVFHCSLVGKFLPPDCCVELQSTKFGGGSWMLLLLNHAPSVICDQVLLQPANCLSHCQCYKLK